MTDNKRNKGIKLQITYPYNSWIAAKALFHALHKNAKVRTFHELMSCALQIGLNEIRRNPGVVLTQYRPKEDAPSIYGDENENLEPDICPHLTRKELKEARRLANSHNPKESAEGHALLFPETALRRGFPDIHERFKHHFEETPTNFLDVFS